MTKQMIDIKCSCYGNNNLCILLHYFRLYEKEFNAQMSQIKSQRKLQVSTAGRSEKIRTYNFAQNRVTDHRIHYSSTDLLGILKGGHLLDDFIQKLQDESRKESLVEMLEEFKGKNL